MKTFRMNPLLHAMVMTGALAAGSALAQQAGQVEQQPQGVQPAQEQVGQTGQQQDMQFTQEQTGGTGAALTLTPATVRQIQQALNDAGYDAGSIDGIWGQQSRSALQTFQQANNLDPTGTLNLQTISRLGIMNDIMASEGVQPGSIGAGAGAGATQVQPGTGGTQAQPITGGTQAQPATGGTQVQPGTVNQ